MDTWLGRLALLKTGLGVFRLTGRGVAVGNEGLGLRLGGGPAGLGGFRPGFLLPTCRLLFVEVSFPAAELAGPTTTAEGLELVVCEEPKVGLPFTPGFLL